MIQDRLISRVRGLCRADGTIRASLVHGSFAAGEGDERSGVEFWPFFDPAARAALDPAAWCARVAPVNLVLRHESGTHVAFFEGLVRGEFHFAPTGDIASVGDGPARGAAVGAMAVTDRDGALTLRPGRAARAPGGPR
ncbi:hypothetical protein [Streptomyces sp. NPDC020983]|uniref:hypothetical protein n=1 Tax=Streptomyces sp. NPDC020983 TaxID=3365106 RepID=UPI0037BA4F68